ncbi:type I-E CRISPR-associated protein Cse1/CasA, partial [Streptomyces mexicanus]|nr:type I-E CRISPR-associated protein Cse1/CasA [Streptomyces mexicanus]
TYLDRWAERLDLFHPNHPVFQCGHLTEYARGPEALHPGSLGGDAGAWFNHELYRPLPPYPAARAAQLLLHLLAYDVAGVKRAVPGDPAAKNGKVYGSQIGPFASSTHCHLTTDSGTLKDVLLLNLPPQPRATDDAPVWERDTPPAPCAPARPPAASTCSPGPTAESASTPPRTAAWTPSPTTTATACPADGSQPSSSTR